MTNKTLNLIKLDSLGEFCTSIINENQLDIFGITVHLKEGIQPETLQLAVNDLVKRLPFINGCYEERFFTSYFKLLDSPPTVLKDTGVAFEPFYTKGNKNRLHVVYGDYYFKIQTTHTMLDGRGFSEVIKALILRYFEKLGINISNTNIISCQEIGNSEEADDPYKKFCTKTKSAKPFTSGAPRIAHQLERHADVAETISLKIKLSELKNLTKKEQVTISEYLMGHIFAAIAKERMEQKMPITVYLPIDCRNFIPTKSLRNFIAEKIIIMPETNDFSEMLLQIHSQLEHITTPFVQQSINDREKLFRFVSCLPLPIRKKLYRLMDNSLDRSITVCFSNLGLIKLPLELEEKINHIDFFVSPKSNWPYNIGCVATGNVLSLTISHTLKSCPLTAELNARLPVIAE